MTAYDLNNAAVAIYGRLDADNGFGLRNFQPGTEVVCVLNGTDASCRVFASAGTLAVSVDGGAFADVAPAAYGTYSLLPLFAGLAAGDHTVSVKASAQYIATTNTFQVTGGTEAIRAAGTADGAGYGPYSIMGSTAFAAHGDRGSWASSGIYSTPNAYYNTASSWTDALARVRGRGDTLKIWTYCNGNKLAWTKDNVRQGVVTLPNTGTFGCVTLGSIDPAADHDYAVSAASNAPTYVDAFMLVGSTAAYASTAPASREGIVGFGDSIMAGAAGTDDSSVGHLYRLALATNRTPYNRGIGGNKIAQMRARTADVTDLNAVVDAILVQAGINDVGVTTIGDAGTPDTYVGDWRLTLDQLIAGLTHGQQIVVLDCFSRTSVTPTTLAPYRTGVQTAIAACADPSRIRFASTASPTWLCQDNGPANTYTDANGDMAIDGLHPASPGYAKAFNREVPLFAPYTVTLSASPGPVGSPITITYTRVAGTTWIAGETVSTTAGDGTFGAFTFTPGQTTATRTYTPASAGGKTLTHANGQGWIDAATTSFAATSSTPVQANVTIHADQTTITVGQTVTLSATATDQFGNAITPASPVYSKVSGVGSVSGSTYTGTSAGAAVLRVTSAGYTSDVTVTVGAGDTTGPTFSYRPRTYMITSGITALATTDDSPVTVLTMPAIGYSFSRVTIFKAAGTAGFVSFDNGATYAYLPADVESRWFPIAKIGNAVLVKRVPSGSNVTGIYADAV